MWSSFSPVSFDSSLSPPLPFPFPFSLPLVPFRPFCCLFCLFFPPSPPPPPPPPPFGAAFSKASVLFLTMRVRTRLLSRRQNKAFKIFKQHTHLVRKLPTEKRKRKMINVTASSSSDTSRLRAAHYFNIQVLTENLKLQGRIRKTKSSS